MNGKSVRIGIVAIFLLIVAAVGLMAANPHGCPPGQGQCKLVQHIVTGKVKCLPLQAVAHPWIVIGDCTNNSPDPEPTEKPDDPLVDPTVSPTTRATATPVIPTIDPPKSPTCTQTPVLAQPIVGDNCDICLELRRQADALERIADAQETQAAKP